MIKDILAVIGLMFCVGVCIFFLVGIFVCVKEFAETKMYERRQKRRFSKPPKAKCFCVDCKFWRKEDGHCFFFGNRSTADCWFCWNAEPIEFEEYKRQEKLKNDQKEKRRIKAMEEF